MPTLQESNSFYRADKRVVFLLLCAVTFLLLYIKISFIENETATFEFLADRPQGLVLQTLNAMKFLGIPFIYLWKITVISFVVWVGCFMFGYRITYSQCWGIALVAECIFLAAEMVKILYFLFIVPDPDLYEVHAFYPLSLLSFFDYIELDKRYAYPLKALNLFEIGYWALLANGIHYYTRKKLNIAWTIVLCSYVIVFFLWLLFYIIVYH